jgi:hypothetical protein
MRSDRLNSILGRMYGPGAVDQRRKQALEADLLSRYRTLHPNNRRWLMLLNPWNRIARFALTGLALCAIIVGACTTETTTDVDLGKHLQLGLESEYDDQTVEGRFQFTFIYLSPEDVTQEARNMSDLLMAQPGVEDANVSISQQGSGEVSLDILAWGEGLDTRELLSTLTKEYPALAEASVTVSDLNTTVKESYASKIGRVVFNVEASGSTPEELRRQFLDQMAAQGFDGNAEVDVQTDGDQQTITIELEEE